jgi:UDP:flavonoid glycosyltransferase YjiC (YdhE family)
MLDKFSPHLVLALFSQWWAQPQPDWPQQTMQPGFVFHDGGAAGIPLDEALQQFLASGEPPLVFTLGSTAVGHPGDFYRTSIEAAKHISARALLIGASSTIQWITPEILSLPYAPYSQVFPHASVIVHQGGSGTTAQALQAGRPMLFVPWGWDQPDNAARVERRGAALSIAKNRYSVQRAIDALNRLRTEPSFSANAAAAAAHLRKEAGLSGAVQEIERLLT